VCVCVSSSAITCQSMSLSHVLNSSDISVGSVVHVSCPAGQIFNDNLEGDRNAAKTAKCMADGNWNPVIADCKGVCIRLDLVYRFRGNLLKTSSGKIAKFFATFAIRDTVREELGRLRLTNCLYLCPPNNGP
jgi:hypothetical protein